MTSQTGSGTVESDLQTAQYLTIGMNLALVLAIITVAVGVALGVAIVVVTTVGLFTVAALGYVVTHVILHRRVASARKRGRKEATVVGALGLIRSNILLYGAFVLVGIGIVAAFGYV